MTAQEVKDALRKRHPAFEPGYVGVGRWVTLEEWRNIDLLALDAWQSGNVVGYEVKVSRSDMRSELLKPSKRSEAVSMCTQFYFAVPAGMLTPEERAYEEPEWSPEDFKRTPCTNPACHGYRAQRGFAKHHGTPRGKNRRGTDSEGVTIHLGYGREQGVSPHGGTYSHSYQVKACCVVCKGYGTVGTSLVEREAPTLWVPRDVGLVVVGPRGCTVLKEAPRRKITEPVIPWPFVGGRRSAEDTARLQRQAIATFARWVSFRPDPRHHRSYSDTIDECSEPGSHITSARNEDDTKSASGGPRVGPPPNFVQLG